MTSAHGFDYAVFDTAGALPGDIRSRRTIAVFRDPSTERVKKTTCQNLIFLASDAPRSLRRAARLRVEAGDRSCHQLVVPESGSSRGDFLAAHERATSALRSPFHLVIGGTEALRRVVLGLKQGPDRARDLIAWAYVSDNGETLSVFNCRLEREEFDLATVPGLRRATPDDRAGIEMDGWWLYWPTLDQHLGLSKLRECAGTAASRSAQGNTDQAARYGAAIRALREEQGVPQSAFSDLTARQVRRIEGGESIPRTSTLAKLAEGHGLALEAYLDAVAARLERSLEAG